MIRFVRAVVLLAVAALWPATAAADAAPPGFYTTTPRDLAGQPGTVIRFQVMDPQPAGGIAFRVLYRSTGLRGQPIAVSAVVVRPNTPAPPGGRPIVAWAHPTTGIARACAPSLFGNGYGEIPALQLMLSRGYVVVATDYPGLGTPTRHPYIVGASEAKSVLDSVRAARAMKDLNASNRFIVWGHSQGGHAALFTGEFAATYAPDLQLMGLAVAAPPTDLAKLLESDLTSPAGKILTAMALTAWADIYSTPSSTMIQPKDAGAVRSVANACIQSVFGKLAALEGQKPLGHNFLLANPSLTKPWQEFLTQNTPGSYRAGAPVLIAQGTKDTIVDPPVTEAYTAALCKRGTRVTMIRYPGAAHTQIVRRSANQTVAWMEARFAGAPVRTPCGG